MSTRRISDKVDVLVVGAGLFGSVAAALCRQAGMDVLVVDGRRAGSGSAAAACLFKPSWLSSLSADHQRMAFTVLDSLYGIGEVKLRTQLNLDMKLKWVPPHKILLPPDVTDTVQTVQPGLVKLQAGGFVKAKHIYVATGRWGNELVKMPPITTRVGCAIKFPGVLPYNAFEVWAPYRQAITFQITPKMIWFGDGTAILEKNYTSLHRESTERRLRAKLPATLHANLNLGGESIIGGRPFVDGMKGGYLASPAPGVWVSNGGGKNGTVTAALHARQFLEAIC